MVKTSDTISNEVDMKRNNNMCEMCQSMSVCVWFKFSGNESLGGKIYDTNYTHH